MRLLLDPEAARPARKQARMLLSRRQELRRKQGSNMTTTLREYWLILILLLAMIATISYHYKQLLTGLTERTVAQLEVR